MQKLIEIYHFYNEKFMFLVDRFKDRFSKRVPLVGHMVHCEFEDHWRAIGDVANYLVWATMPFWLGALAMLISDRPALQGESVIERFYWLLISTLRNGELLILSTALLAPAFSVALTDRGGQELRPFPGKLSHATVVAVLMVICASLFAVHKGGKVVNQELLFSLSAGFAGVSLLLFYIAAVYNHNIGLNGPEKFRDDEQAFVDQYDLHRGSSHE